MTSNNLKVLAKTYLAMVDEPSGHTETPEKDAERTAAHEALMDTMQKDGIPFNSRFEARWIARWLLTSHCLEWEFHPPALQVYWVKPNAFPREIRHSPPEDNKDGWIPVIATFFPFMPVRYERNHE